MVTLEETLEMALLLSRRLNNALFIPEEPTDENSDFVQSLEGIFSGSKIKFTSGQTTISFEISEDGFVMWFDADNPYKTDRVIIRTSGEPNIKKTYQDILSIYQNRIEDDFETQYRKEVENLEKKTKN